MRQGYFVGGPRDGELVPFEAVGRREWACPDSVGAGIKSLAFAGLLDISQLKDPEIIRYRGVCVVRPGPYIPVRETWFVAPGVSKSEIIARANKVSGLTFVKRAMKR